MSAAVTSSEATTEKLGIPGVDWASLATPEGLARLDAAFQEELARTDRELASRFLTYRASATAGAATGPEVSALLIDVAKHLSLFLSHLFGVEDGRQDLQRQIATHQLVLRLKNELIAKKALKRKAERPPPEAFPTYDAKVRALFDAMAPEVSSASDSELALAEAVVPLLDAMRFYDRRPAPRVEEAAQEIIAAVRKLRHAITQSPLLTELLQGHASATGTLAGDGQLLRNTLALLETWCYLRSVHPAGRRTIRGWISYREVHKTDPQNLVRLHRQGAQSFVGDPNELRRRDGFLLTDERASERRVLAEVDYCILCHERSKDSCSKGIIDKKAAACGAFKKNALGVSLHGCPLDEHISEMHLLHGEGDPIAALAMICITNPMLAGTGHRICNDCMKACIYQTQEPVDIPQIETRVLTDVLALRWGFEIWSLLTRWNPLNAARPYALPYNGKKVLVVGLGPAGYTLAHHLLNEGFGVVGIDGLKIEPLPPAWLNQPVRDFSAIACKLDERVLAGFGGVSEYGITVRWDKNFLTALYLNLARRAAFAIHGGVRFGGTLTTEDAFAMGFDHVAIAAGAGKPTLVPMRNNLLRGIRQASDFLMALQLTGAFKRDSLAALHVRLPALVIGGGLTAIDAATELFAYYPAQVEKLLLRWETLQQEGLLQDALFDDEERAVLDEMLEHGRAVRAERQRASLRGESPNFVPLVRSWGGVRLVYRKHLQDSPAYRLNHEEVQKSLEEGIEYLECLSPIEALAHTHGAVRAVVFEQQHQVEGRWQGTGELLELPARSVCVAAGTSPNTMVEREAPGHFAVDKHGRYFQGHHASLREDGTVALLPAAASPDLSGDAGFFTSYLAADKKRCVSFYGDNHPQYAGSVVKAMASAKDGYKKVTALFAAELATLDASKQSQRDAEWGRFCSELGTKLRAEVVRVQRLTSTIVEVVVRAPFAAAHFQPGQFYRLQNYESHAALLAGTRMATEGIALTGAWVDRERGLLSLIVLEMGASSRLCATLKPGEPVVCMGPTGTPTEIPTQENVLLAGGGLGNAVLFSIARALKEAGNRVLYFAGYRSADSLFKRADIEAGTDQVVWACDQSPGIEPQRPGDLTFVGTIVGAMVAYARGELGEQKLPFAAVDRILAIGSDGMMAAVQNARSSVLAPYLGRCHTTIASINSPMQCMMKEICAQCLQRHVEPDGKEHFVFSCKNQDQPLDAVDFAFLNQRLRANSLDEKIANLWLSYCQGARERDS